MRWIGPAICLLALASLQVPWILCHSDCHSRAVPALGEHACHAAGAHPEPTEHASQGACHCGGAHEHGHDDGSSHGHEPGDGDHVLVQAPALCVGEPVELAGAIVSQALSPTLASLELGSELEREGIRVPKVDPYPIPPASAVCLLL